MINISAYLKIKTEIEKRVYEIIHVVNSKISDTMYIDFPNSNDNYELSFDITQTTIDITFKKIGEYFQVVDTKYTYIPLDIFQSSDTQIITYFTELNAIAKTRYLMRVYKPLLLNDLEVLNENK